MSIAIITGRITADPSSKTVGNQKSLVTFSVAENFKKGGEKQTIFFDIEAWGNTAEFISEHAKKGDAVQVLADIQEDKFEDKQGNPRKKTKYITKIGGFTFLPAARKDEIGSEATDQPTLAKAGNVPSDSEEQEDLPW